MAAQLGLPMERAGWSYLRRPADTHAVSEEWGEGKGGAAAMPWINWLLTPVCASTPELNYYFFELKSEIGCAGDKNVTLLIRAG